jgi:hypothetical protein
MWIKGFEPSYILDHNIIAQELKECLSRKSPHKSVTENSRLLSPGIIASPWRRGGRFPICLAIANLLRSLKSRSLGGELDFP